MRRFCLVLALLTCKPVMSAAFSRLLPVVPSDNTFLYVIVGGVIACPCFALLFKTGSRKDKDKQFDIMEKELEKIYEKYVIKKVSLQ